MLFFIWCFGRQVDHVTYFHRYFPGAQMASEPHCVTMQSKTETKQTELLGECSLICHQGGVLQHCFSVGPENKPKIKEEW